MSDEFGTVNYKRGDRAREIERLRQHYLSHREALVGLMADAPTEQLEHGYQRMIHDIDAALAKVAELEGRAPQPAGAANATGPAAGAVAAASAGVPPPPVIPPPHPARAGNDLLNGKTEPGDVPLQTYDPDATQHDYVPPAAEHSAAAPKSRMLLMIAAAVLVLGVIGWMIWRAGAERRASDRILEAPATATTSAADATDRSASSPAVETIEPVGGAPATLTVSPATIDYGTLRKGTRAVRQFTVRNRGTAPLAVSIARSKCRCLYYEYREKIAPGASETVTVTVDGARAKAGALQETLNVTSKDDPAVTGSVQLTATVQ